MASTSTTPVVPSGKSIWDGGVSPMGASYGKLMMWFFLLSDAFTFSALLITYGLVRSSHDAYTGAVNDFVFSQKLNKRILFKGYAKNIMNPAIKTVYANPQTGGKWYGNEYINRSYKRGAEIMIGFTYNLF